MDFILSLLSAKYFEIWSAYFHFLLFLNGLALFQQFLPVLKKSSMNWKWMQDGILRDIINIIWFFMQFRVRFASNLAKSSKQIVKKKNFCIYPIRVSKPSDSMQILNQIQIWRKLNTNCFIWMFLQLCFQWVRNQHYFLWFSIPIFIFA